MSLFYISTSPSASTTDCPPTSISYTYLSPPSHSSLADPLPILGLSPSAPSRDTNSPDRQCFNCLGPHILSACPFRRDAANIAANRAAFQEEHGARGGGAKLGGEDTERRRMMELAERFRAGIVSAALKEALGYGCEEREGEVVEYPWFWRMRDWGYPPGWVLYDGGRGAFAGTAAFRDLGRIARLTSTRADPLELVRDRIGRDEAWEDIKVLEIYDGVDVPTFPTPQEGDSSVSGEPVDAPPHVANTPSPFTSRLYKVTSSSPNPTPRDLSSAPSPHPAEPPPPLPPGSPPPLPLDPPPPLPLGSPPSLPSNPPPSRPPLQLVNYRTYLFSSPELPVHRPDLRLPFSNPLPFAQHMGLHGRRVHWGGQLPRDGVPSLWRELGTPSTETPRRAVEAEIDDGEVEMDMSSSEDETQ